MLSLVPQARPDPMELACMAKQAYLTSVWLNPKADLEGSRFVLTPTAPARLLWDVLVTCTTIWTGFIIPVGVAYLDGADFLCRGFVGMVLLGIDGLLLCDIALNFRTGIMDRDSLVLDPWHIALWYLRSWLVVDILCALPLVVATDAGMLFPLLCALKLLRMIRLVPLCDKLQKEYGGGRFPTVLKVGGMVVWCAHVLACGWRLALTLEPGYDDKDLDAGDAYVSDLYWVWMTTTTVGYGDIVPKVTKSRLFAIPTMMTSPVFFGAVVTGVTHLTRGLLDDANERRVSQAACYMRRRGLSQSIVRRVQHNLRNRLQREPIMRMDPELFALLSPAVQKELSLSLLSGTVLQFPLFRGARHSFVAALAQRHTWVECLIGDLVVEDGQRMDEMVFVVQGRLCVHLGRGARYPVLDLGVEGENLEAATDKEGATTIQDHSACQFSFVDQAERREVELESGAWFGEICLFDQGRTRTSTVIAVQESDLAVLKAAEYLKVVQMYPRLWERHLYIASGLKDGSVKAEDLAFRIEPHLQRGSGNSRVSA